jgi:hypothetical protein
MAIISGQSAQSRNGVPGRGEADGADAEASVADAAPIPARPAVRSQMPIDDFIAVSLVAAWRVTGWLIHGASVAVGSTDEPGFVGKRH